MIVDFKKLPYILGSQKDPNAGASVVAYSHPSLNNGVPGTVKDALDYILTELAKTK